MKSPVALLTFWGLLATLSAAAQDGEAQLPPSPGGSVVAETINGLSKLHPAFFVRKGRAPGLELAEGWEASPLDRRLVVAVHGFYSNRDREESMLTAAIEAGLPVGRFEYASEQSIGEAAKLLSQSLKAIADKQPGRQITLVTHSLGGVIARSVVETPELDPGNVRQLLLIAPPNHGTNLATFASLSPPARVLEEPEAEAAVGLGKVALATIVGPVAEEMKPGSPFLTELNARKRNAGVQYTIFLGTKAPLSAAGANLLEVAEVETERRWRWTRWVGAQMGRRLSDLPELRRDMGDGVVSVASGRLEGVDDVVLLPFHHNEPLWDADEPAIHDLQREILQRLRPH